MRRAQSTRHHGRPSTAQGSGGTDDLSVLKETVDSVEDSLRKQLLEKDRENDKLRAQIQGLQAQLMQRPPVEAVQVLEKEYKNLELILQGTQRENERAMMELDRGKTREKMLERELTKLAGDNWQEMLEISPSPAGTTVPTRALFGRRGSITNSPQSGEPSSATNEATLAQMEQIRLLVLGLDQRMQAREGTLTQIIQRAEGEGAKFEELRKNALAAKT